MNRVPDPTQRLLVILDADLGNRLGQVWHGQPVWIVMSPVNEPAIRSLWASHSKQDHLSGITGLQFDKNMAAEDRFVAELDTIDLHHGPYSTNTPYTILDVIGAQLTGGIREALSELGFTDFTETAEGFSAERSLAEAKQLRE
jgi:hypothetical protein